MTIFKAQHPLWGTWINMRLRCKNPNATSYPWYGGMGIKVCQRWDEEFWNFVDDMGEKPAPEYWLARHDQNGDYSPDNCYWGTRQQACRNSRRGLGLKPNPVQGIRQLTLYDFKGERLTLREIGEKAGIRLTTLRERIKRGWTLDQAATIPVNKVQSEKVLNWNRRRALEALNNRPKRF